MIRDKVFWYEGKNPPRDPIIHDDAADVVIVGGGMSGLMCASALADKGKSVIVLERDFCGAGASGKTSGFICPDSELELSDLISNHGKEGAKLLWEFVVGGVSLIKGVIERDHIICDYQVEDSCYIASSSRDVKHIINEYEARESLGYESTLYNRNTLPGVLGSHAFYGGVRYPDTFGINGFLFCQGLAERLEDRGVKIYEQSPVSHADKNRVTSGGHTIQAESIVLCVDHALPEFGMLKNDLYQLQTFLAISKPLQAGAVEKIFPERRMMVWDSKLIYNYFRITGDNRLLLGGANMLYTYTSKERHDPEQMIRRLDGFFSKKFPHVTVNWDCLWPGMVGVSKDVLPIAGQSRQQASHYFLVAPTGLPWGAALGYFIADKILDDRPHPLDAYFSPYRQYPLSRGIEMVAGKPISFLLSHFLTKYFGKLM